MGLTDTVCDPSHCFGGLLFIRITGAVSVWCCSAALLCTNLALTAAHTSAHGHRRLCCSPCSVCRYFCVLVFLFGSLSGCDGVRASKCPCRCSVTFVRCLLGQSVQQFPCFGLFRSSEPYYTLSHRDKLCGYPLLHTLGTDNVRCNVDKSRAAIFAIFPP